METFFPTSYDFMETKCTVHDCRGDTWWPYVIDARAWLGDMVSGTEYMSLCNVLFLIKYKVHVFFIFRILKAQKYK